jgi:glucosamine 6-phosphate synthetase-like amidotransferase/phosphosugar isomerase protein
METVSVKRKEKIIKILSAECEARGTDATGVAYLNGDHISIFKRHLPAHKLHFKLKNNPSVIMGHTRMTTQGSEIINANNH